MFDFPNAPTNGQTVTGPGNIYYRWDGTKWATIAGMDTATVSDTPPSNPTPGMLWWDSIGCQMYICYSDGTSTQWVVANSGVGSLPDAPTDGGYYARRNSVWSDMRQAPQPDVGRNLLHNAMFNIQQRGMGPWTANGYTADRWILNFGSDTPTLSVGALADTHRAQIGDESATFYMNSATIGNAAAGSYTQLQQAIEGVRRLAGKTVTVSFYANSAQPLKLGVSVDQFFGGGGSPSASVQGVGQSVSLPGTGFSRYSLTFSLPSIAGKTLGTNNSDSTFLNFWISAGSTWNVRSGSVGVQTGTVTLWGVQLEIGSVATPLEKPDPQQELAKCQRFYQTATVWAVGYALAGTSCFGSYSLPVKMRAVPTVAFTNANYANASNIQTYGYSDITLVVQATTTGTGTGQASATVALSADL